MFGAIAVGALVDVRAGSGEGVAVGKAAGRGVLEGAAVLDGTAGAMGAFVGDRLVNAWAEQPVRARHATSNRYNTR